MKYPLPKIQCCSSKHSEKYSLNYPGITWYICPVRKIPIIIHFQRFVNINQLNPGGNYIFFLPSMFHLTELEGYIYYKLSVKFLETYNLWDLNSTITAASRMIFKILDLSRIANGSHTTAFSKMSLIKWNSYIMSYKYHYYTSLSSTYDCQMS